MKNYILSLGLVLSFLAPAKGQMTLDNTFSGTQICQIEVVNLSLSGKKFSVVRGQSHSSSPDTIFYYNMDYSFWKKIICPSVPGFFGDFYYSSYLNANYVSYASETLFNTDSLLEVAVSYTDSTNPLMGKVLIINENGLIVDSIPNVYDCEFIVHSINSTTFKATVLTPTGPKVYSLPGTLPCDPCSSGTLGLAKTEEKPTNILPNPIPNPSKNEVKLSFTLPDGATRGIIDLYSSTGQKVKSFTVDNRFGFIMLDNTQLQAGMYYYNLTVNGEVSSTQKMVVIK